MTFGHTVGAMFVGVTPTYRRIEVHVSAGLPSFNIVGVATDRAREMRDRVRAAVLNAGYPWFNGRITVNGEPDSAMDAAVAVAVLFATDALPAPSTAPLVVGTLGLDGAVRNLEQHYRLLADGWLNVSTPDTTVLQVGHLAELHNRSFDPPARVHSCIVGSRELQGFLTASDGRRHHQHFDMQRALICAAAGCIDTSRYVRHVHSSASTVALCGGGGKSMRPGDASLAHGGILLLEDVTEFAAVSLDCLRQPLAEGIIRISGASGQVTLPAMFSLVVALRGDESDRQLARLPLHIRKACDVPQSLRSYV